MLNINSLEYYILKLIVSLILKLVGFGLDFLLYTEFSILSFVFPAKPNFSTCLF